ESVTLAEFHLILRESGNTDLGTLQVPEYTDHPALRLGGLAQPCRAAAVIVRPAMGEVDARHVQSGTHQTLEHTGAVGRRTEGDYDLGSSHERAPGLPDRRKRRRASAPGTFFQHGHGRQLLAF